MLVLLGAWTVRHIRASIWVMLQYGAIYQAAVFRRYLNRFYAEILLKIGLARHCLNKAQRRNLKIVMLCLGRCISVTGDKDILEVLTRDDQKMLERQLLNATDAAAPN